MSRMLPASFAELLQVELSLDLFLVLAGIIINPTASRALQPCKIFREFGLSHAGLNIMGFQPFCKEAKTSIRETMSQRWESLRFGFSPSLKTDLRPPLP